MKGFNVKGLKHLEKAIEETYSGSKAKKIKKDALNAGGDVVVDRLKKNFESFKLTGYSQAEIMRSNARTKGDIEELKVGWNGEQERWRLVHLNEFGYVRSGKQYTPTGFGVIAKTLNEVQDDYMEIMATEMRKRL